MEEEADGKLGKKNVRKGGATLECQSKLIGSKSKSKENNKGIEEEEEDYVFIYVVIPSRSLRRDFWL